MGNNRELLSSSSFARQVGGSHYADYAIQPLEFCVLNNIPFLEGNVIKYICRWRKKNGVQDLEKAKHYIEMLIELEEKYAKSNTKLGKQVPDLPDPGGVYPVGSGRVQTSGTATEGSPSGCLRGTATGYSEE
jgi:hypothetical protein